MTTRQAIAVLQAKGYSITYYSRKDGGVLIRYIDGMKFSGAKGNAYARSLVGEKLSERREVQLTRATSKHIAYKGTPQYKVSDYYKKELQKVQRHWRQRVDVSKTGQPTMAKLRWRLEHEGRKEANRLLREWERYTLGIAYTDVVKALKEYIEEFASTTDDAEMQKLADDIWKARNKIRDEWIQPAYAELYKLNNGGNNEDVINNVRRILRLA